MPAWRAENPSLTSSPVRPFTPFDAAQSSRMMRCVGALEIKTGYFQPGFDLVMFTDDDNQPWVSLSEAVKGVVVSESRAD